jgi:membrane protein insertase Oxa1/YidC/SpoIIIJ
VKGDLHYGALFGMAGVFFVLFYTFSAALVLYWTASNFFQLLQQMIENRFS